MMRLILLMLAAAAPILAQPGKGYTIPLLDLSSETFRQVVVDREPGQYLGHPTTALLPGGKTILIVYPKGHGKGPIMYKRSDDGGRTWSARLPTPENWETSLETPTIHWIGSGRMILFSGLYPIRMAESADNGASWSPLKKIGDFGGIVAMSALVRLSGGRLMAVFHDDGRFLRNAGKAGRFVVYKTMSLDNGRTWSEPSEIASHPQSHLCEPGIVPSPDGRQLAMLMRENSRKFNSFVSFSNDEGATWTEPRQLPGALTGDRHTGVYAPDGRLFITFRDTTLESPTRGDWVAWVGRYQDIVNGGEGQYRVRLMDNTKADDCCYPGLERLPGGTLVTTTYGHWTKGQPPYIVSIRLTLEELDRKARRAAKR